MVHAVHLSAANPLRVRTNPRPDRSFTGEKHQLRVPRDVAGRSGSTHVVADPRRPELLSDGGQGHPLDIAAQCISNRAT